MANDFIREKREEKGMTIRQLALKSGVSAGHISRLEHGERKASPATLKKLSKALNVDYKIMLYRAGHLSEEDITGSEDIVVALKDDPELLSFWEEIKSRDDLKMLFHQTRKMKPHEVRRIVEIIKMTEDEEAAEDY